MWKPNSYLLGKQISNLMRKQKTFFCGNRNKFVRKQKSNLVQKQKQILCGNRKEFCAETETNLVRKQKRVWCGNGNKFGAAAEKSLFLWCASRLVGRRKSAVRILFLHFFSCVSEVNRDGLKVKNEVRYKYKF